MFIWSKIYRVVSQSVNTGVVEGTFLKRSNSSGNFGQFVDRANVHLTAMLISFMIIADNRLLDFIAIPRSFFMVNIVSDDASHTSRTLMNRFMPSMVALCLLFTSKFNDTRSPLEWVALDNRHTQVFTKGLL